MTSSDLSKRLRCTGKTARASWPSVLPTRQKPVNLFQRSPRQGEKPGFKIYATRCFRWCHFVVRLKIAACGMSPQIFPRRTERFSKTRCRVLEHVLFLRAESTILTNLRRGERDRLKLRGSNENGGLVDSRVSFVCLYCAHSKFSATANEEKQFIFALGV